MLLILKDILKQALLPPGIFILALILGLGLMLVAGARRRGGQSGPHHGAVLVSISALMLALMSLPIVADGLTTRAQGDIGPLALVTDEEAIVILSAGARNYAREFRGPTVDTITLERLRYGANLHRKTGLPVLVTGGIVPELVTPEGEPLPDVSIAGLMAETLQGEFQVPVTWVEDQASNTWDNARFSADLLRPEGVDRIVLVTHGWHMPRAVESFEKMGFSVTPAPMGYREITFDRPDQYLPDARAFAQSYYAVHELVGRLYYRFRFSAANDEAGLDTLARENGVPE